MSAVEGTELSVEPDALGFVLFVALVEPLHCYLALTQNLVMKPTLGPQQRVVGLMAMGEAKTWVFHIELH